MSKDKLPPDEGGEKESKGYVELDLSRITDRLHDGFERALIGKGLDGGNTVGDNPKKQGRLALPRFYAAVGYIGVFLAAFILVGITVTQKGIEIPLLLGFLFFIALGAALVLIGKYEIRYDESGFSTQLGRTVLRRYAWSEVTGVADRTTVFVNGKKLFVDHTMEGFGFFYEYARMACKGKGKATVPSEKKRRNRQKSPDQKK